VFILKVMTHREYDDGKWKEECGCHEPPPQKDITKKVAKSRGKGKRGVPNGND